MREGVVSVIVPVYNVEEYLEACVASICGQTYPELEILLIDDGSMDESFAICRRCAEEDKRIRAIRQENRGVSVTRNRGIAEAQGEYILFVDSDDTIEAGMIELLVENIRKEKADVAFCGLIHDYPDRSRNFPEKPVRLVTDGVGAVKEVLKNYIATAGPVCKLFCLSCVPKNMFPADLTIGEDAYGVVVVLLNAARAVLDTQPLYHYNHREESLMSSDFSERDMDLPEAYRRILELPESVHFQKEAEFRQIWAWFHAYDKMILTRQTKRPEERVIRRWLRRHARSIWKNPYVGRGRKISLCALMIYKRLYYCVVRLGLYYCTIRLRKSR